MKDVRRRLARLLEDRSIVYKGELGEKTKKVDRFTTLLSLDEKSGRLSRFGHFLCLSGTGSGNRCGGSGTSVVRFRGGRGRCCGCRCRTDSLHGDYLL